MARPLKDQVSELEKLLQEEYQRNAILPDPSIILPKYFKTRDETIHGCKLLLENYYHHCPELAEEILRQVSICAPGAYMEREHPYASALSLLYIYQEHEENLKKLEPLKSLAITKIIGGKFDSAVLFTSHWETIPSLLESLVEYCFFFAEKTKPFSPIPIEGNTGLLELSLILRNGSTYLDKKSFRRLVGQASKREIDSWLTWADVVYTPWSNLQPTTGLGALLLEGIASRYALPPPNLEGIKQYINQYKTPPLDQPKLPPLEYCLKWMNWLSVLTNEHCRTVTDWNISLSELVSFLLTAVAEEEEKCRKTISWNVDMSDKSELSRLFKVIGGNKCLTIDEVVECAQQNISDYDIHRKIGEGTYKKVFLGVNRYSQESKAIKVVELSPRGQDNLTRQQQTLHGFVEREAVKSVMVKRINSPYLINIDDIRFESGIDRYVIYEELFEKTLDELIHTQKYHLTDQNNSARLDKSELLQYATQIAEGLAALHRHGLVHGDLTAFNIGIKEGMIKLTDFGLASSLGMLACEAGERVNVGSVVTRAPELFTGEHPSVKSDVWSLGVIAYAMAAGKYPPFIPEGSRPLQPGKARGTYEQEVLKRIEQSDLSALCRDPAIPFRVQKLLSRCLIRDSKERWSIIKSAEDGGDESSILRWLQHPAAAITVHYTEKGEELISRYYKYRDIKIGETTFSMRDVHDFDFNYCGLNFDFKKYGTIFVADQKDNLLCLTEGSASPYGTPVYNYETNTSTPRLIRYEVKFFEGAEQDIFTGRGPPHYSRDLKLDRISGQNYPLSFYWIDQVLTEQLPGRDLRNEKILFITPPQFQGKCEEFFEWRKDYLIEPFPT